MATQIPTDTIKLTDVRQQFSSIVNQVYRKERRILVEKSGIPVAAIVSPIDLERLNQIDADRDADFAVLDDLRALFADVDPEELEREGLKAIEEIRAERRAQRQTA